MKIDFKDMPIFRFGMIFFMLLAAADLVHAAEQSSKPKVLSTSQDGKFSILEDRYKEKEFFIIELYVKAADSKEQLSIDIPDNVSVNEVAPLKLECVWSRDDRFILLKVAWKKSDELFLCDRLKLPLKFENLADPDWKTILSEQGVKADYDTEAAHFDIHIESIGFDEGGVPVVYSVKIADVEDRILKFKYVIEKEGIKKPLLVK